jgi:hypothetical protein
MRGESKRRYFKDAIVELCKYLQHSCKAASLIVTNTLPYSPVRRARTFDFALPVAKGRGTMPFTFAESGSVELNQSRALLGDDSFASELFIRRLRKTRIQILPPLHFAVPYTGQVLRLSSVCQTRVGNTVSLFAPQVSEIVSRKQVCRYCSISKCWVERPGGNNAVDKA